MRQGTSHNHPRRPGRPRSPAAKTPAERSAAYRQRMRQSGYVLRQQWVPDYDNPEFMARMRQQVAALYGRVPEEQWVFDIDIPGWK